MSDQLLAVIVIVTSFTVSVWAVALAAETVDLGLLPVRRRRRVQWCREHYRQVRIVGAVLLAVLVLAQVISLE